MLGGDATLLCKTPRWWTRATQCERRFESTSRRCWKRKRQRGTSPTKPSSRQGQSLLRLGSGSSAYAIGREEHLLLHSESSTKRQTVDTSTLQPNTNRPPTLARPHVVNKPGVGLICVPNGIFRDKRVPFLRWIGQNQREAPERSRMHHTPRDSFRVPSGLNRSEGVYFFLKAFTLSPKARVSSTNVILST